MEIRETRGVDQAMKGKKAWLVSAFLSTVLDVQMEPMRRFRAWHPSCFLSTSLHLFSLFSSSSQASINLFLTHTLRIAQSLVTASCYS